MIENINIAQKNIRVSIIIPTLNEEKLIENILKQFTEEIKKKFDLEVIVSDGGSTDRTIEIARKYADKVIEKTDKSKQNISRGRNIGASLSLGDVLIFFNADTRITDPSEFLTEAIATLNIHNVGAIACPIKVFPELEKASDRAFHGFYNAYVKILNKYFLEWEEVSATLSNGNALKILVVIMKSLQRERILIFTKGSEQSGE